MIRFNAKERATWPTGFKRCNGCMELLPYEKFGDYKTASDGKMPKCKECRKPITKAYYDKWLRYNAEMRMFCSARARANTFSLPFEITIDDIVIPEFCPVLGIKLEREGGKLNNSTPSLDRFIPELGYVPGNIEVISWRANWIKMNSTLEEIEKLVVWMRGK